MSSGISELVDLEVEDEELSLDRGSQGVMSPSMAIRREVRAQMKDSIVLMVSVLARQSLCTPLALIHILLPQLELWEGCAFSTQ
jgi:hypothetical protein